MTPRFKAGVPLTGADLRSYIRQHFRSQKDFARTVRLHEVTVSRLCRDERIIEGPLAFIVENYRPAKTGR